MPIYIYQEQFFIQIKLDFVRKLIFCLIPINDSSRLSLTFFLVVVVVVVVGGGGGALMFLTVL